MHTNRVVEVLLLARGIGALLTGMFVSMWVAYALGKMDTDGVLFITVIAVFAIPLLAGSMLLLKRKEAGLPLLKFGSVLFIAEPFTLLAIWTMKKNPEYRAYMSGSWYAYTDGPKE